MSGGPSLGRSPARTSSVTPSSKTNPNCGDIRVDTFSRAGLSALLFFWDWLSATADDATGKSDRTGLRTCGRGCDGARAQPLVLCTSQSRGTVSKRTQSKLAEGSMLSLTLDPILTQQTHRPFRHDQMQGSSQDAYGAPAELLVAFLAVIADTLREILAAAWPADVNAAWQKLLREIKSMVSQARLRRFAQSNR
jgi:hypothetical protein